MRNPTIDNTTAGWSSVAQPRVLRKKAGRSEDARDCSTPLPLKETPTSSAQTQYRTDEIRELDRHLVHSFADLHSLEEPEAVTVIAEADGAHVYDTDGNRFIDGIGGLWYVNVGHARNEIADARKVHLLDRRSSCGQPIIITEHTAESLPPADRPVTGAQA